jgi:hypothetical protein
MLKSSVKHFVKVVWQHIVLMHVVPGAGRQMDRFFKCSNVCFRIIQYILVHLLVLIISECMGSSVLNIYVLSNIIFSSHRLI